MNNILKKKKTLFEFKSMADSRTVTTTTSLRSFWKFFNLKLEEPRWFEEPPRKVSLKNLLRLLQEPFEAL